MEFLIIGAGAIGTYLGVSLAHAGHGVTFLVRPTSAAILQSHGLSLVQENGERWHLSRPRLATSAAEALRAAPHDLAILALKTYHLPTLLQTLGDLRAQFPPLLCLQNGVESEATLSAFFGPNRVLSGTVTTAVARRRPGEVAVARARGVGLGQEHPLAVVVAAAFATAGLRPRLYPNAAAMKWSKLLTNLLGNATSAILDMPPAAIFAHRGLARLEIAQLKEALAVMDALGLPVVNLPGASVRPLAWGVRHLPLALLQPLLYRAVSGGRGNKMPSFHIDLHSGRGQTEVDALNGAVVRYGERLGVPTPVNRLLTETLQALTAGEIAPDAFRHHPEALLALWA